MQEAKVEITKDTGHKRRWGLGNLVYRQERNKRTLIPRRLGILVVLLFSATALYLLLSSPLEENATKRTISPPESIAPGSVHEFVQFKPTHNEKPKTVNEKSKKSIQYSGPQVIRFSTGRIPPGAMAAAKLVTGASNGPVRAEVTKPLSLRGETLVPAGTVLLGQGSSTQSRLTIRFDRMVHRDGSDSRISATAYDFEDRMPGVRGSRLSGQGTKLAASIGLGFVGGLSEGLQEREGSNGVSVKKPSLTNGLLNGAARASLEQSQELIRSMRNEAPVIEVGEGTPLLVVFQGD